jgi:hypothetical protein
MSKIPQIFGYSKPLLESCALGKSALDKHNTSWAKWGYVNAAVLSLPLIPRNVDVLDARQMNGPDHTVYELKRY